MPQENWQEPKLKLDVNALRRQVAGIEDATGKEIPVRVTDAGNVFLGDERIGEVQKESFA